MKINVENISKTFGNKKNKFQALKNVSFEIPDGASVAIIGKSGSGKSTLIHAMSGLDAPEKGHVFIDGIDILSMKRDLSGGQKQRLAIARAIVNEPKLIFADEPTGNLDSVTGAKIEKLLFDYNKNNGATLVVVTHDEDLAAKCEIQIRVKDGEIESIKDTRGVKNA